MYRTCAFCNGTLDGDGGPSGLGVGRRLAFDEWRGRLWVICGKCARWNLTPLDDRLERIEALARAAGGGGGRVLAATDQVALIRWQAYDLVVNKGWKPAEAARLLGIRRSQVDNAKMRIGRRLSAIARELSQSDNAG